MDSVLAVLLITFQVANVIATAYYAGQQKPITPTPSSLVLQAIKDGLLIYLLAGAYLWPHT